MSRKFNLISKIIYSIIFILTAIYMVCRIFYTIPVNLGIISIICGLIILFVEIWDFFDFSIYYFNILMGRKKKIKIVENNENLPNVDIFIATYNEDEKLIEETIKGCLNLEYNDKKKIKIYVCDDGNRENIKKLAREYRINYISRTSRTDAKAGNYNNALRKTKSPYVVTFDADMVPEKDFLLKSIPYFLQHKKIGFVQFPQEFVNPDIYQYRFGLENKIPYEQSYFYKNLQLYKNSINAAIYCGTNTVFLRKALEQIGGFATGTLSEDIATGMLIQEKGYIGVALDELAAKGQSVLNLKGFLNQRLRWARGCIQMAKKYKILKQKGLSIRQKLEYISCISYWFFGLRRIVYLVAPILFAILGIVVIDCELATFLKLWIPTYLLKRFGLDLLQNYKRSSTWTKIYETILTPTLALGIFEEMFFKKKTNFDVTPKNDKELNNKEEKKVSLKLFIGHLLFFILNIIGLIVIMFKINNINKTSYIISIIWIISNIFYLLIALIFDTNNRSTSYIITENKATKYSFLSIFKIFFSRSVIR